MKKLYLILAVATSFILLLAGSGCKKGNATPTDLLNKYFSSAIKQDYGTTYDCYYAAYHAKVTREDYIRHRKEASLLQSYKIVSVKQIDSNNAQAEVLLTFAPSALLKRSQPVTTTVKEDLVKENGEWKIKVWQ